MLSVLAPLLSKNNNIVCSVRQTEQERTDASQGAKIQE